MLSFNQAIDFLDAAGSLMVVGWQGLEWSVGAQPPLRRLTPGERGQSRPFPLPDRPQAALRTLAHSPAVYAVRNLSRPAATRTCHG